MKEQTWILGRLKQLGRTQAELAREVGLQQDMISKVITGIRAVKSQEIQAFAEALDLPVADFVAGLTGRKLDPNIRRSDGHIGNLPDLPPEFAGKLSTGIAEIGGTEFASIGRFDAAFSAGPGSLLERHQEPIGFHLIEAQWLRTVTQSAPEHLAVVRVAGDSMESTLMDGDWVLIDRTQTRFSRSGIYALDAGGTAWVKRIHISLSKKLIQIISDNPRYPVDELPENEVTLLGRVVSLVARKMP